MLTCIHYTCSLLFLARFALADYQIQTPPDGPDFRYTYTLGDPLSITWTSTWTGTGSDPVYLDLFITWFNSDSYTKVVFTNTTAASTFRWTIDVPASTVQRDDEFVFRFVPARDPPNYIQAASGGKQSPSRGFRLVPNPSASSSVAGASSTTASSFVPTSSIASTTSSAAATTSTASTSSGSKSSTPIGAIVGGVLGGLALTALIVIAFFLFKLSKKREAQAAEINNGPTVAQYQPSENFAVQGTRKQEMASVYNDAQELHGTQVAQESDGRLLDEYVR
ncbi:hypothetical protein BKA63DRAFT_506863 [Paraphoma chrysanthemicola]|nr:hypothetical protein BKA63DRAFT_506863 [Paraphoma chrysanthemicola]